MIALVLLLLAAAALCAVASRPGPHVADNAVATGLATAGWLLCVLAAILATVLGARGVVGSTAAKLGPIPLDVLGNASLRVDRLSGLFLVLCFGVAVPVLLAGTSSRFVQRPRLAAAIALTLASILVIVTADHLFLLLFGWESLTISFYLLAGFDREQPGRARASVAAIVFGKASGACLLVGGLMLAVRAGNFTLAGLGAAAPAAGGGGLGAAGYALLLLGFGIKVGLVPMQVWVPPSYAAAPGPARALMAGVAVNVGFYGMWRTLQVLGPPPVWLVATVLVVAGVTAILGIAHAAVHPDLAGLIAWSSVENAGVITAGFGVAMAGSAAHNEQLLAAGLLAATAQAVAHALGKSLLFTATAAIENTTGTTELDRLRGISRRLPWSGTGLVIGALTLAGLPLTAGFASEWLTLEALMQQFRINGLPIQLAAAIAGALVALTVGVAGVTFVRLIALTAYGQPPTRTTDSSPDRAVGHRIAIVMLSTGCLAAAAFAPLVVRFLAAGLQPLAGSSTKGALASPWVLQPVFSGFSALSPSWLWIILPALTAVIALVAFAASGRRLLRVRRVPAWSSASPGVDRGVGYTSVGYANPMRTVLANLLLTRGRLHTTDLATPPPHGVGDLAPPGTAPDESVNAGPTLRYQLDVVEVVEHYLYRPLYVALMAVVHLAKRLQSGRLDAYLTYMLIAVIAVLAVVTATA